MAGLAQHRRIARAKLAIKSKRGVKIDNPTYLGDAVYAYFDGYGIELRLNWHDSKCIIYLDPEMIGNLHLFWHQITDDTTRTSR